MAPKRKVSDSAADTSKKRKTKVDSEGETQSKSTRASAVVVAAAAAASSTPGREAWKEVTTPEATARVRKSKAAVQKKAPAASTTSRAKLQKQEQPIRGRAIEAVPAETSSSTRTQPVPRDNKLKKNVHFGATGYSTSSSSSRMMMAKPLVIIVVVLALILGSFKLNARMPAHASNNKDGKKPFSGILSFRPFFRPVPANTQSSEATAAARAAKTRDAELKRQEEKARKKRKKEKEEEEEAKKRLVEETAAAKKAEDEKKKRKEEEDSLSEKKRRKKEEKEQQAEEDRARRELLKKQDQERFEKGVIAEKKKQEEAKWEAELRKEERESKKQKAVEEAEQERIKAELERLRRIEEQRLKEEQKATNKMLTMGGDYSHSEHDVAGLWRGAKVVTSDTTVSGMRLTSPWLHHHANPFSRAMAWVHHAAPPVNKLYNTGRAPSDYFSFSGDAGTLTITFHSPVHIHEVRLFHPFHDAQRAPKEFRVLGWEHNPASKKKRRGSGSAATAEEPSVLGHFRYSPNAKKEMQYFEVMRHKQRTAYAAVTLDVSSNHHDYNNNNDYLNSGGGSEESDHHVEQEQRNWTNLWRVQVMGHEVSQLLLK
jgi:hypothetical protein